MLTLICDLGGVLFTETDPQRRIDAWRSANGGVLGVETAADLRDDALRGFEAGAVGETEYALHLRARLGWVGSDEQLLEGWYAGQGPVALDVLEMLSRLRERGWQLIAATDDNPWDERCRADRFGWALTIFETVVSSAQVGTRRPDPRFFAELRTVSGSGPRLYVDDDAHNVAAARRAGLDAHLFTTAAAMDSACRHLVVPVG